MPINKVLGGDGPVASTMPPASRTASPAAPPGARPRARRGRAVGQLVGDARAEDLGEGRGRRDRLDAELPAPATMRVPPPTPRPTRATAAGARSLVVAQVGDAEHCHVVAVAQHEHRVDHTDLTDVAQQAPSSSAMRPSNRSLSGEPITRPWMGPIVMGVLQFRDGRRGRRASHSGAVGSTSLGRQVLSRAASASEPEDHPPAFPARSATSCAPCPPARSTEVDVCRAVGVGLDRARLAAEVVLRLLGLQHRPCSSGRRHDRPEAALEIRWKVTLVVAHR